jgi:ATP-dependent DNA helicase RecG
MIVAIDRIIESQIRTYSKLGKNGKFYTAPEYPYAAWHEAVVNACVHRSYSLKSMNIFVRMFDDRLVIESPGPFMPFVTPENIYDVHARRNYFLMDALFYLDFVKCENEGTKRIRDSMAAMELPPPEFAQKEIGGAIVRVTLRNNVKERVGWIDKDASDLVGSAVFTDLGTHERRCVNFAAEHKTINASDVMRLTQLNWHAAKKLMMSLTKRSIFDYKSKFPRDPNAHWVLKDKREATPS